MLHITGGYATALTGLPLDCTVAMLLTSSLVSRYAHPWDAVNTSLQAWRQHPCCRHSRISMSA